MRRPLFRIAQLESRCLPDMRTLPDADLMRLADGLAPEELMAIRSMSDADLEALVAMTPAQVSAVVARRVAAQEKEDEL